MGEEKCPSDGSTDQELGVNMVRQVPAIETETEGSLQEDEVADVKPEGGYGWLCVVALLAINAFTWGKSQNPPSCLLRGFLRISSHARAGKMLTKYTLII